MRCLIALLIVAVSMIAHNAFAQETLPPVEVTAHAIGGDVTLPLYVLPRVSAYSPTHMSMTSAEGQSIDLTKAQVCKMLKDSKPKNCSTSIYPPAPNVKSSSGADWAGNGCGAGSTDPLTNALISAFYGLLSADYSGNLNAPIKSRPDIDFTATCNKHDGCYTSSRPKASCDFQFGRDLNAQCGKVGDTAGMADCSTAIGKYEHAVDDDGEESYEEDQQQYQCASWGDSMKKDGCGSM